MTVADIEDVKKLMAEVEKIHEEQNKENAKIINHKINECFQTEMKKCIYECENQLAKMKNTLQEKELINCRAWNEDLKKALQKQEQYNRSIFDMKNKLLQKISALEEEHIVKKESELSQQMSITLETRKEKRVGTPPPRKIQNSGSVVPKEPSQRLAKEPQNTLNNIFSDRDSIEWMADIAQIDRHSDALSRGESVSPMIYKRRRIPWDLPLEFERLIPESLEQIGEETKIYKNKRSGNKAKKLKKIE